MVLVGCIQFHPFGRLKVNAPIWNSTGSAAAMVAAVAKSAKVKKNLIVGF
jgi:hypothetical protein